MNIAELFQRNIYTIEKGNRGQTIICGNGLDVMVPTKKNYALLTEHVITEIRKALDISKKYNNNTSNVHIYLKDCGFKNINLSLYKKLVKTLNNTFDETLNCCYIYDLSKIARATWAILRVFLDPVTRKKIKLVAASK